MSEQSSKVGWVTFWNALTLNAKLYENVRNTPKNHRLAFTIVCLAALSHTLGSAVILLINRATVPLLLVGLVVNGLSVVAGYYLWTFTIWRVGQWLKPIDPTYGDLLSPIGFAYAPQVLNFLTLVPLLGEPIERGLSIWSLLAAIVAVREGLSIRSRQAVLICLVGFPLIQLAIEVVQIFQQNLLKL